MTEEYHNIKTEPAPDCPECGSAPMKLRKPGKNSRTQYPPFWGCQNFPDCHGRRQIDFDTGLAEGMEDWSWLN